MIAIIIAMMINLLSDMMAIKNKGCEKEELLPIARYPSRWWD